MTLERADGLIVMSLRRIGAVALFLVRLFGHSVLALRRPGLIVHQI